MLEAFRAICAAQFAVDVEEGDAGLAARDADAMRRIAHNLSSVLATLQQPAARALALSLDTTLCQLDWPAAEAAWAALRLHLLDIKK